VDDLQATTLHQLYKELQVSVSASNTAKANLSAHFAMSSEQRHMSLSKYWIRLWRMTS